MVKRTAKSAAPKAEKKTLRVPLALKIVGGVAAALLVLLCGFTYLYPNVFPGVTVGPIAVSGLSRSAAAAQIEKQSAPLYEDADVSVTIYEQTYRIPVRDVLENVDAAQSAENAYAVGRTGNPLARMWDVVTAVFGRGDVYKRQYREYNSTNKGKTERVSQYEKQKNQNDHPCCSARGADDGRNHDYPYPDADARLYSLGRRAGAALRHPVGAGAGRGRGGHRLDAGRPVRRLRCV